MYLLVAPESIADAYDIKEQIGKGTCGEVWRAIHKETGAHWAVKIIETRRLKLQPDFNNSTQQLMDEAHMLREIAHPNIVRLQDIFQSESAIYIVMVRGDMCDGVKWCEMV